MRGYLATGQRLLVILINEEEDQNHGLNRRLHKIGLGPRGKDLVVDMGHQCIEKMATGIQEMMWDKGISGMEQGLCGMDLAQEGMDQGSYGMDLKKTGMALDQ